MAGEKVFNDNGDDHVLKINQEPLKLWKLSIGAVDNPKIDSIRYYWDDHGVYEFAPPLKEYENIFT